MPRPLIDWSKRWHRLGVVVFNLDNYAFGQMVALRLCGEAARVYVIRVSLERVGDYRFNIRVLANELGRVAERQPGEIAENKYLPVAVDARADAYGWHCQALRNEP